MNKDIPSPGTINRVTPAQLRAAWSRRDTHREESREVFRHAVYTFRRVDMARILGVVPEEISAFLEPRVPRRLIDDIRDVLVGDEPPEFGNKADTRIGQLRGAGWTVAAIAEATPTTRHKVSRANPSGPLPVPKSSPVEEPDHIRFVTLGTVPNYIFVDGGNPPRTREDLTESDRELLRRLDDDLSVAMRAAHAAGTPEEQHKADESVNRHQVELIEAAHRISKDSGVSLLSLSLVLRPANRYYLSRMARRYGIRAHVPPSVAKVSPVRQAAV